MNSPERETNAPEVAPPRHRPSTGFYAALVGGIAVVVILIGLTMTTGLPGLHDTPTNNVGGKSVVGKSASD